MLWFGITWTAEGSLSQLWHWPRLFNIGKQRKSGQDAGLAIRLWRMGACRQAGRNGASVCLKEEKFYCLSDFEIMLMVRACVF